MVLIVGHNRHTELTFLLPDEVEHLDSFERGQPLDDAQLVPDRVIVRKDCLVVIAKDFDLL